MISVPAPSRQMILKHHLCSNLKPLAGVQRTQLWGGEINREGFLSSSLILLFRRLTSHHLWSTLSHLVLSQKVVNDENRFHSKQFLERLYWVNTLFNDYVYCVGAHSVVQIPSQKWLTQLLGNFFCRAPCYSSTNAISYIEYVTRKSSCGVIWGNLS